MGLNVFFQKSCSAFLVPAFRQCLRQQRLYDRGLSMSKFQRVIGFLDGFFRQMLFQENICENRMPTPRVGVNFHRPLHVRFCFGEFLFPHQRLAQSQQRRNMFGIKLQSLCPIGLSLLLSLHLGKRSEEHTSELQSRLHLVCRLLLEKKKKTSMSWYLDTFKSYTELIFTHYSATVISC